MHVPNVVIWRVSLKHRQDIDTGCILSAERVVAVNRQPLMLGHGESCLLHDPRLAHPILRDCCQQPSVTYPPPNLCGVFRHGRPIATVRRNLRERAAVHDPIPNDERTFPRADPIDADERRVEVFGIARLMQPAKETHSR
jgi:hypothetical protein